MICKRCGKVLENSSRCSFCGFENSEVENVREMTRAEKNFYNGVTIDVGESENNSDYQKNFNHKAYTNFVNLGNTGFFSRLFEKFIRNLMNNNLLAKIIAGLIFVAFIGIFFFVALPMMFFFLALGIAIFSFAKFMGKF